jgi:2-polyprenyl-3-methyl-5-hydroxy-6-metoxy-1,4-benzoquinol methylase
MEDKGLALTIEEEQPGGCPVEEQAYHRDLLPAVRALLPVGAGLTILDAGCGYGFLSAQLAALGHQVTGVDYRPRKIEAAQAAFPQARYGVATVYEPLTAFMPRGGWDAVVASEVIEHLYSPQEFLRNMHRHLRPGGCLILSTPYHGYLKNLGICLLNLWDEHHWVNTEGGHIKFFSPATLRQALAGAGFEPPTFRHAGRLPWLWRSMICRSLKPPLRQPGRRGRRTG